MMTKPKNIHPEISFPGETILQGMPELAYVFDGEGKMLRWNKNVEMVLGFSKEELLHRFTGDFIDEPDREKVISEFFKVLTEGEDRTVEYNMLTKSGKKIPYLGSGSLAVVDGKEYLVGIAINISKLRKAEEKLIAQLAEINRLKNQLQAENIYLQLLFNARISRSYLLIASTMLWI